ncbi:UDP-N-acetylglucosamine--N-acetylmuramyl-(pentapeptide) pyrophosphoryl-undecaprenol N-acetylglucosamine transferase [Curtobacterium sp. VKM Ac-2884]|uniref:UDP-N-acetylglucosamine--N-acetylmuramyl- (pentapeptide) pyrophosphoryl-undecaprenol N-acetylglucosamine transferase n=1 Tax=Curtobacterium sp. VKM Ac-2884 TaxID=2783818 RepID=UPI00188A5C07|nr:glycosyltransferase [Curtobacterium sp. VKM Ac-2884]MBF4602728.1 glycosyltransferase [Curtobacterium sp. VKM Ac-2884]
MVMLHSPRAGRPASGSAPLRVVVAAGGTGGHVFPGLAVAAAIERLVPGSTVTFSGTPDRLEARLVPAAGYRLDTTPMQSFPRRVGRRAFGFPLRFARCVLRARRQLRARGAQVVVGVGGYPSVPAVVAAWTLRIPVVVHESNATPGLANVLAARLARHVACAFDPARTGLTGRAEVRRVGIPILPALASCDRASMRATARERFGVAPGERFVVVSGGSLGAASLDRAAVDLACARSWDTGFRMLVKASPIHVEELTGRLHDGGGDAVASIVSHIDDMAAAYSAADVVVVRAGACTVAEVEHLGVPAVLVPSPYATDDHQTANAEALVAAGARVVVVPDADLDARALDAAVSALAAPTGADPRLPAAPPHHLPDATSPHAAAADAVAAWAIELARTDSERTPR